MSVEDGRILFYYPDKSVKDCLDFITVRQHDKVSVPCPLSRF